MYTQRNVPKYNTCLNKQFSLLTFRFKYIFTNLIVRTILQSLSNIILYITNALVVTKTTFGIHTSFSTMEKSLKFSIFQMTGPIACEIKSFSSLQSPVISISCPSQLLELMVLQGSRHSKRGQFFIKTFFTSEKICRHCS